MKSLKILVVALVAMATVPAMAQDRTRTTDRNMDRNMQSGRTTALTGAYVGVYGGYDWTSADSTGAGVGIDPEGWDGGFFAGYKFDQLFGGNRTSGAGANIALEAFYGFSNSDETVGGVTFEKDNEWGISLRPGISIFDSMFGDTAINPYGIVGYRSTEFDVTGAPGGSEWYDGFELGLGTQLVAMGDVGLLVEYSHVWYDSEGSFDPDSDNVRLGLSYHF